MHLSSFYLARDNYDYISSIASIEENNISGGRAKKTCIYVFIDPQAAITEAPNFTLKSVDGHLIGLAT